jgi:hypothetical protein
MKNLPIKLSGFLFLSLLAFGCSKTESGTDPLALKDALTSSTQKLNNAVTDIASTQAFELLSITGESTLKSGTTSSTTSATGYKANIPLSLVAGVYDYKPLKSSVSWYYPLIRFFVKSPENSRMVVNLPLSKMKNPRVLRQYRAADSLLTNNFSISVTDYLNNYNSYHEYEYTNAADISIDKVLAGSLKIKSNVSRTLGKQYASQFAFTNGYTAKYLYASGDTTVSSFTILKDAGVVYKEELITTRIDSTKFGRERQYSLTIGDVKIVRKSDRTSAVYLKNVLQPNALLTIVDHDDDGNDNGDDDGEDDDEEHSICKKRDIQITFEDGTVTTISTLIGNSITDIKTLYTSLHNVYFAAYIVDWLAYDIYFKR